MLNELREALELLDQVDDKISCLEVNQYERNAEKLSEVKRNLTAILKFAEVRKLRTLKGLKSEPEKL
jgi:hypothetical protein